MTGRNKEEMEGVTLLGNQGTKYPQDYAPEVLETFVNKVQLSRVYIPVSDYRTTGFCNHLYFLCTGKDYGRIQIFKTIFIQLS